MTGSSFLLHLSFLRRRAHPRLLHDNRRRLRPFQDRSLLHRRPYQGVDQVQGFVTLPPPLPSPPSLTRANESGFQVPPAELEGVLLTCPFVADCAVIGVWSEAQATELPRAYG